MFDKEIQASIEVGVELFRDLLLSVAGFAKDKYRENDPFGRATRKYIGGLIDRYNLVKVLGMREPVPLKSLYVRANILEKISARAGLRPEELAEFFDFDRRTFGKKSETVDGERIVNKLDKFIVLGKPGAGKTTYLKFLTLMMLDPLSQIERRRLPIFVTLREWADERIPLREFIVKQFDICGFEQADLFVEKMLAGGECLVLFDGLDEVSSDANQDDIIRQIRNFTDKYADNQFVISCRVAAWNGGFERFTDVEMADFNEEQMETFIKNWFSGEPKVAAECWERLKNSPSLRELASVPLLLTLLCLTYHPEKGFPQKRSTVYIQAIRQLLEDWDEKRVGGRVKRDSFYKELSTELKEEMLAEIAWRTFSHNLYFIEEEQLARMIEVFLKKQPEFANSPRISGRKVLGEIESNHSILIERAKDVYSFAHLTFQEYFTARYIVDNQSKTADESGFLDEKGKATLLEKIVEKHLYDPKWKEVFLLVAGMLGNADELLMKMRIKSNEALEVPEIDTLFKSGRPYLMPAECKCSDVVRRAFSVYILICQDFSRFFNEPFQFDRDDRVHSNDNAIFYDNFALFTSITKNDRFRHIFDCIIDLSKKTSFYPSFDFFFSIEIHSIITSARNAAHDIELYYSRQLDIFSGLQKKGVEIEFDVFFDDPSIIGNNDLQEKAKDESTSLIGKLGIDLKKLENEKGNIGLMQDSIRSLEQYYKANALIFDCLSSGSYVTAPIREKLLHEMFLPKEDLERGGGQ